jgi:hypothetical protein
MYQHIFTEQGMRRTNVVQFPPCSMLHRNILAEYPRLNE